MAKPKIAAIVTEYRFWSHADVVVGRLLAGCSPNDAWRAAKCEVVALWCAQHPANDMSRDLAARHGFTLYPSIREALTLGGSKLAVDAVCFIGEHGEYPDNAVGQKLYPRFEFFNEVLEVYESEGRGVPTFFDKHLSYNADLADVILRRVRRLKFPFLCGSSIPVTVRNPRIEFMLETPIRRAVSVSYGPVDAYGFHAFEVLQCMMERRRGGETGIASVQMFEGGAAIADEDPLLEAALRANPEPVAPNWRSRVKDPVRFAVHYTDGTRGDVYLLNGVVETWLFAAQIEGRRDPVATHFGINTDGGGPLPHFDGLVDRIEEMFITGREPHPPERTLLTTVALALCFESKREGFAKVTSPLLNVSYRSPEKCWFQEK